MAAGSCSALSMIALACGLDHATLAHDGDDVFDAVVLAAHEVDRTRGGKPCLPVDGLGARLVHGKGAGKHAGPRVGDAHELEQALHATILAVPAVQGAKDHVWLAFDDLLDHVHIAGVDLYDGKAHAAQGLCAGGTGPEGYLALAAAATLQQRDLGLGGNAGRCVDHC